MIKKIILGLTNKWKEASSQSSKINKPKLSLIGDMILSRIKYGATTEDYFALEFYKKNSFERKKFLTSGKNWFTIYKLIPEETADLFNNKYKFNKRFEKYLKRGWIFADKNIPFDKIEEFINQYNNVIIKPFEGSEGKGIFLLGRTDSKKKEELKREIESGESFIIEEILTQHPEMEKLNPDCVNTIRVETIVDKEGKAHITNSVAIMGTKGGITNNAHNGGIMCHIDLEGGFITGPARNPEGVNSYYHPDSHLVLPGFKIPMWDKVKEFALALSNEEPKAKYIGWDIAIREDGPVVIEGNTRPGHCTQACDMVGRWPLIKSYL